MRIGKWDRYCWVGLLLNWLFLWLILTCIALSAYALLILVKFPIAVVHVAGPLFLPMATLSSMAVLPASVFLSFGLFARKATQEGALMALSGAGVSSSRLFAPAALAALAIGMAVVPLMHTIEPNAYRAYKIGSTELLHHPEVLLPILAEDPTTHLGLPIVFKSADGNQMRNLAILIQPRGSKIWLLSNHATLEVDHRNLAYKADLGKGVLSADLGNSQRVGLSQSELDISFENASILLPSTRVLQPQANKPKPRAITSEQANTLASSKQISSALGFSSQERVSLAQLIFLRYAKALFLVFLGILAFALGRAQVGFGTGVWILCAGLITAFWVMVDRGLVGAYGPSLFEKGAGLMAGLVIAISPLLLRKLLGLRKTGQGSAQ